MAIRRPPRTTVVFDTYWRFAVERQAVYFRRLEGKAAPWTSDPTLLRFRFTNAYRAADRTSQFLVRKVIYEGIQTPREVAFRTLLFRLFNLPSTWQALTAEFGQPEASSFDPVTAERRLDKVEEALTPLQRALAWLDEAHAFGSLETYVDSLLDQPPETSPINRLAREAASAARAEVKRPPEGVDEAVRKALRATIFRFELVIRINVVAHEMIDREVLVYAALAGQLAMLVSDDRAERLKDPVYLRRIAQCRDVTLQRVDELLAEEEARSTAENRYLGGHPAMFPDGLDKWAEQLRLSQEQAVLADRIADLDGVPPATPPDRDKVAGWVAARIADLIEPARSTALEELDEGHQAHRIATNWLRSKRHAVPPTTGLDGSVLAVTR